jgi:uncharacterized protein YihD (DUF1040 family)
MRDPKRIKTILKAVESEWSRSPDLRLGQLLANLLRLGEDIFYLEDEILLKRLRELPGKRSDVPNTAG